MFLDKSTRPRLARLPERITRARDDRLADVLLEAALLLAHAGETDAATQLWPLARAHGETETEPLAGEGSLAAISLAAGLDPPPGRDAASWRALLAYEESELRQRFTDPHSDLDPLPTGPLESLRGLALLRRARALAHPPDWPDRRSPHGVDEPAALTALERYLDERGDGPGDWDSLQAMLIAADLNMRHGAPEQGLRRLQQWCRDACATGRADGSAASFSSLAPAIARGALREPLGLSPHEITSGAEAVLAAARRRTGSAAPPFSWPRFLQRLSLALVSTGRVDLDAVPHPT